jgi:hypothetical protein
MQALNSAISFGLHNSTKLARRQLTERVVCPKRIRKKVEMGHHILAGLKLVFADGLLTFVFN